MRCIRRAPLLVAVLLLFVAACSGDDDGGDASGGGGDETATTTPDLPEFPQTEEGLVQAATEYAEADIDADKRTFVYLSEECRDQWKNAAGWERNVQAARSILTDMDIDVDNAELESVEVTDYSDDGGSIQRNWSSGGEPIEALNESDWVYEDGGWRTTSCGSATGG